MAGPWERYSGATAVPAPSAVTVGTPRPPEPEDPVDVAIKGERLRSLRISNSKAADPAAPKAGEKPLPATAAAGIQANLESLRALDSAIAALKSRPQSIGPGTGMLGDTFTQFNDPDGTEIRSRVGKIGAMTIHDLSGAAVSATEAPRFQPFVPTVQDRPEVAEKKLNQFREALQAQIKESLDYYSPANGYMPYQTPQAEQFRQGEKPTGYRLTPEQEKEWAAFLATTPTKEAIDQWWTERAGAAPPNSQEIADAAANGRVSAGVDYSQSDAAREAQLRQEIAHNSALQDSDQEVIANQGATLGLSDEAAGLGRGLSFAVQGKNPVEGYQLGRDAARLRLDDARGNLGASGTALEIGSGFLSGNVTNALAQVPSLGGRMLQGVKAGATGGGLAGFGYGEGPSSLLSAGGGAAGGAVLGAALPMAGGIITSRAGALQRMTGRDPELPRRLIANALDADGNTPAAVGQAMDAARGRGSPMMLADTGENARGLLASVARQQGGAKALTKTAIIDRQNAQAERISEAVVRDLGPTANIRDMKESLIDQARTAARPLYEQAYAAPGAGVVKLDDLATRPAFQKALKNSINLVLEEGGDPTALGIAFNEAGDVLLDRSKANWQTLDYLKRGLDDVLEKYRDKTTGRLVLDGQGRATQATLRTLIARMDKVNPAYGQARGAYAGPAKIGEAVDKGFRALSKSPDDILAQMRGMSDGELEGYRLGVRKAIVDLVNSKRDGGDKVAHLLGTPKSRAALSRIFGGRAEFQRFIATLQDEAAMGQTYKRVATGSPTAENMAADATTNDAGLAETVFDVATRGQSMWGSAMNLLDQIKRAGQFGVGEAGDRARESVAALLTETDPQALRDIIATTREALARQRRLVGRRSRNAVRTGRTGGYVTGYASGRATEDR